MYLSHYPIRTTESGYRYGFVSSGPNGDIEKVVEFREMEEAGIYNLGFGDKAKDSNEIDDLARTNNEDMQKVIATVAAITYDFMLQHPGAIVFATGSTPSRTRLYQSAINTHITWLRQSFHIFGYREGHWEPFKRGNNYEAFYAASTA